MIGEYRKIIDTLPRESLYSGITDRVNWIAEYKTKVVKTEDLKNYADELSVICASLLDRFET